MASCSGKAEQLLEECGRILRVVNCNTSVSYSPLVNTLQGYVMVPCTENTPNFVNHRDASFLEASWQASEVSFDVADTRKKWLEGGLRSAAQSSSCQDFLRNSSKRGKLVPTQMLAQLQLICWYVLCLCSLNRRLNSNGMSIQGWSRGWITLFLWDYIRILPAAAKAHAKSIELERSLPYSFPQTFFCTLFSLLENLISHINSGHPESKMCSQWSET